MLNNQKKKGRMERQGNDVNKKSENIKEEQNIAGKKEKDKKKEKRERERERERDNIKVEGIEVIDKTYAKSLIFSPQFREIEFCWAQREHSWTYYFLPNSTPSQQGKSFVAYQYTAIVA